MGAAKVHKRVMLTAEGLCNVKVSGCACKAKVQAFRVGIKGKVRHGAGDRAPLVEIFLRVEVSAVMDTNGIDGMLTA